MNTSQLTNLELELGEQKEFSLHQNNYRRLILERTPEGYRAALFREVGHFLGSGVFNLGPFQDLEECASTVFMYLNAY